MTATPLGVRRIVTANGEDGRSLIAEDAPARAVRLVPSRPGFQGVNIWRTVGGPTPVAAEDTAIEHQGVMPPEGGTVLRVIDFPPRPENLEERRRQASASLAALFPDAQHERDHSQPGMHRTRSVDYAIVLSGAITAVMDHGEAELRAGDILIQRGTNHGWENRSDEIARVAFVLIDGV